MLDRKRWQYVELCVWIVINSFKSDSKVETMNEGKKMKHSIQILCRKYNYTQYYISGNAFQLNGLLTSSIYYSFYIFQQKF